MKYMGSKDRIKKHIVPVIQKFITDETKFYLEPFVGGCNVIDSVKCYKKIGSDNHKYLIALHNESKNGIDFPSHITREEYSDVRNESKINTGKYSDYYIGLIGFLSSYNGRWFDGGYSGIVNLKNGKIRDYYDEAKRNYIKQIPLIKDVDFRWCDYSHYTHEKYKGGVIYCDIPYKGTKQYSTSKNFNHEKFWDWVRVMSKYNTVIVSETQAPYDFECIWEQEVIRTVDNTKRVKSTEKLFKYKGE